MTLPMWLLFVGLLLVNLVVAARRGVVEFAVQVGIIVLGWGTGLAVKRWLRR